jgi:hypothetical protein
MNKKIIYTAKFGKEFLTWHQWVYTTRSEEEIDEYETIDEQPGKMTPGKEALFKAWIKDQEILAHTVYVDTDDDFMKYFEFTIFPQDET